MRLQRNYKLGNRIAITAWSKWRINDHLLPFIKLVYQNWAMIDGIDKETTVPGRFPFPAGITNPSFFGGKKINIAIGSDVTWKENNFTFELNAPIYQNLNGIQPKESLNFSVSWNTNF